MRKRILALAAVVGLAVGGGALGMQSASAACEFDGLDDDDPRGDGNEVVGVYVEDVPADYALLGERNFTDEAWVEVQDDGEHAPVAVEAEWNGQQHFYTGTPLGSHSNGLSWCSDNTLNSLP